MQAGQARPAARAVSLLMTDVESSTRLWEAAPEAMGAAMVRHDELAASLVAAAGGTVIRERGEGDSTFAVFADPAAAVRAALQLQLALTRENWPPPLEIRVRMAVHCGVVGSADDRYYGTEANRCARLRGLARGGEVLVSDAVAREVRSQLPDDARLVDLGSHRLKDVARPERVHRLAHAELRGDFPPITPPSAHPNNLPLQVTSFVGRDREAVELGELVRQHPLVTVHGPGGVGKTRLAVETAADLLEEFPDGIWLVDLSTLTDGDALSLALASVLGIRDQPGRSHVDTLIDHLQEARALLLLDNCEHVVAAAARLAGTLLRSARHLRVLATSRENLGAYGERIYTLAPLGVPAETGSITAIVEMPAARLLIERVREVRSGFVPDDADAPVIAAVCRRLDGIPLAMELAAARASSLSLAQIERRLDDRFRLLRSGSQAHPPRQQTLEALVDWSYSLLEPAEQVALRRLAVFTGPFDLVAAEQVAAADVVMADDIVDILDRLVRRSLVVAVPEDPLPYRQLDTIRAYAHGELVEAGEFESAAARHSAYHLGVAEQSQFADAASIARTRAMMENLRAAVQRSVDSGDEDTALRLCSALLPVWIGDGHLREARQWLSRALAMSDRADPTRVRAQCSVAWLALALGEHPIAMAEAQQALLLAERDDDDASLARAHHAVARCAFFAGDYATARIHVGANLEQAQRSDNRYLLSDALTLHGLLSGHADGDWAAALDMLVRARAIVGELGDAISEVAATFHVGLAQECAGLLHEALTTYAQTVRLGEATQYDEFLYCAHCALVRHAAVAGDHGAAATHLRAALTAHGDVDGLNVHRLLESAACLALARGDTELALRLVGAAAASPEDVTEGPAGVCDELRRRAGALRPDVTTTDVAQAPGMAAVEALQLVRVLAAADPPGVGLSPG